MAGFNLKKVIASSASFGIAVAQTFGLSARAQEVPGPVIVPSAGSGDGGVSVAAIESAQNSINLSAVVAAGQSAQHASAASTAASSAAAQQASVGASQAAAAAIQQASAGASQAAAAAAQAAVASASQAASSAAQAASASASQAATAAAQQAAQQAATSVSQAATAAAQAASASASQAAAAAAQQAATSVNQAATAAAQQAAQQAATSVSQAATAAAQAASASAGQAATAAAQQASTSVNQAATAAAQQAAQQAASSVGQIATTAAQAASASAGQAATAAAQQAATSVNQAASTASQQAAQQAATSVSQAATTAAQAASASAGQAATAAAQQAATSVNQAATAAAQQAATSAITASESAAQHAAATASQSASTASQQAAASAVTSFGSAAQQASTMANVASDAAAQQASQTVTNAATSAAQAAASTVSGLADAAVSSAATSAANAATAATAAGQATAPLTNVTADAAAQQAASSVTSVANDVAAQQAASSVTSIANDVAAQQAASSVTSIANDVAAQQAASSVTSIANDAAAQQAASSVTSIANDVAAQQAASSVTSVATDAAVNNAGNAATAAAATAVTAAVSQAATAPVANIAADAASAQVQSSSPAVNVHAQKAANPVTGAGVDAANQQIAVPVSTVVADVAAQQVVTPSAAVTTEGSVPINTAAAKAVPVPTVAVGAIEASMAAADASAASAVANSVSPTSTTSISTPASTAVTTASLNFGSGAQQFAAPNSAAVSIIIGGTVASDGSITGGTTRTVNPGDLVTAAEAQAVQHIITTGTQGILINAQGQAIGGNITLMPTDLNSASDLFVPQLVSLNLINFNSTSPITIADHASIFGSVFAFHDTAGMASILNFGSLDISTSGLLSGSLPTGSFFNNYFASSGLTINALTSVVNAGTITSPGALAINAGTIINNSGLLSASSVALNAGQAITNSGNIAATLAAVNLNSGSGQYFNSGMISAISNINVATLASSALADINFKNASGVLEASNAINFRSTDFMQKADLDIIGGHFLSQELNLNSGNGIANAQVNSVSGTVNITASDIGFSSQSGNVTIGNILATDDPIITANTGAGGLLTINGPINGFPITIITDANLQLNGAFNTSTGAGNQNHIVAIAGAAFNTTTSPGNTQYTGASGFGGNITTGAGASFTTAGGEFMAIAHQNAAGTSGGVINLTGSTVSSNGGRVNIIGERGVTTRVINSSSGDVNIESSNINLTAPIVFQGAGTTTNNFDGQVLAGSLNNIQGIAGTGTQNINFTANVTTAGGNLSIDAGAGNVSNSGIAVDLRTEGVAGGNGGFVTVRGNNFAFGTLGSDIISDGADGAFAANAGAIDINATGTISIGGVVLARSGSGAGSSGNGANITLLAGGDVTLSSLESRAISAGGAGGSISVTSTSGSISSSNNLLSLASGTGDFNGGSIKISAPNGSYTQTAGDIVSSARGAGTAGNILIDVGGTIGLSGGVDITAGGQSGFASHGGAISLIAGGDIKFDRTIFSGGAQSGGKITINSGGAISRSDPDTIATNIDSRSDGLGGTGGAIDIDAVGSIDLGRTSLYSRTLNGGVAGGAITIDAGGDITVGRAGLSGGLIESQSANVASGAGGDISITSTGGSFIKNDTGSINSGSFGTGAAGDITIKVANNVTSTSTAGIYANVDGGLTGGSGGKITVDAGGNVEINGAIYANANSANGENLDGGDITIRTTALTGGGFTKAANDLNSSARGAGIAGNILVNVNGAIDLSGGVDITAGGQSGFASSGGAISLIAGGDIKFDRTIYSGGAQSGGKITINSGGAISRSDPDTIATNIDSRSDGLGGTGGAIDIDAVGSIDLGRTSLYSRTLNGGVAGGAITIDAGGDITVGRAGLSGGLIESQSANVASGAGGDISITSTGGSFIKNDTGSINSGSFGTGAAGDITIKVANNVTSTSTAGIYANVDGGLTGGSGGKITVDAGGNVEINGAIYANANSANGENLDGGDITIRTTALTGGGFTKAANDLNSSARGDGKAGNILIDVNGDIALSGGVDIVADGQLDFSTAGVIDSKGGNITLRSGGAIKYDRNILARGGVAGGNITISSAAAITRSDPDVTSTISNETVEKNSLPGVIDIDAATTIDFGRTDILSRTREGGNGGAISIDAVGNINIGVAAFGGGDNISSESINVGGNGGKISITSTAGSFNKNSTGTINSGAFGAGTAGDVTITVANNVNMANTGFYSAIFANVDGGLTGGSGGKITVDAGGNVEINGAIYANANSVNGENLDGGDITIRTTALTGGRFTKAANDLNSSARGDGKAGNILIDVNGAIALSGGVDIIAGGQSGFASNGGDISLIAGGDITFDRTINSGGAQSGGKITINSGGAINKSDPTGIETNIDSRSDGASGKGGAIDIDAALGIDFGRTNIYSRTFNSGESGGDITIDAGADIVVGRTGQNGGAIESQAVSGTGGSGGNISITSTGGSFIKNDNRDIISRSLGAGTAGSITVNVTGDISTVVNTDFIANAQTTGIANNISLTAGGNIDLGGTVQTQGGTGGGDITIRAATGFVAFRNNNAVVIADGTNASSGGAIDISGSSLINTGTQSVDIFSRGNGAGDGGSVSLAATGDSNIDLRNTGGALSGFHVNASGGAAGNGGAVKVSAGDQINVINSAAILVNGTRGGIINLTSGTTASGANNNLNILTNLISAGTTTDGAVTISALNAGRINVDGAAPVLVRGGSVTVNTEQLNMGATNAATIQATDAATGNIQVQSNAAAFGLTVNLNGAANNSQIVALNDLGFNSTNSGAININVAPGQGVIAADGGTPGQGFGSVRLNGGTGAVNVDVNHVRGCVGGSGNPFNVTTNSAIVKNTAALGVGGIVQDGSIAIATNLNIIMCGPLDSNLGTVSLTSGTGAANFISQVTGATVEGQTGVTYNTANLNLNSSTTAVTGNLDVQASAGNPLTVNFQTAGSSLNATAGNVRFNNVTAGLIDIDNGSPNGLITAGGNVELNGGANTVSVSVDRIIAPCIGGTGTNISIVTATGDLNVGNINANGNLLVQVLDPAGNISTCGPITNILATGTNQFLANTGAGTGNINFGANVTTNGGSLNVQAGAGDITDSAQVTLSADGAAGGNSGGLVTMSASDIVFDNAGSSIFSEGTGGASSGGSINLTATNTITGGFAARTRSNSVAGGSGRGGDINLTTTNGLISVGTLNARSRGNTGANTDGGNITVNSGGGFTATGLIRTIGGDTGSNGDAGNITINAAGNISLSDFIDARAFSSNGNGGAITINSTGGSVTTTGAAVIDSTGSGTGVSGAVDIDAATNISFGANVTTGGGTLDVNSAGGNIVDTATVILSTQGFASGVNGGAITMVANNINLNNSGTQIDSDGGGGASNGGAVSLTAVNDLTTVFITSRNATAVGGTGIGADITMRAGGDIAMTTVVSRSLADSGVTGNGGNIDIETTGGNITGNGLVRSAGGVGARGDAGNLRLVATGNINLNNGQIDARASGGGGNGGNITITAGGNLSRDGGGSNLDINASGAGTGLAGTIDIDSGGTIGLANTSVVADGQTAPGTDGVIDINAPGVITFTNVSTVRSDGTGNSRGGQITIQGSALNAATVHTVVQANGSGSGDGGVIVMNAIGDDGINYNSTLGGGFQVLANGGNTGSGGSFTSNIGSTLTVQDNGGISVAAGAGGDGNGGIISLTSGTFAAGVNDLVVNGNLIADASGAGVDGTVTLRSLNGGNVEIGIANDAIVRGRVSTVNSNNSINIGGATNTGAVVSTGGAIDFDAVTAVNVNNGSVTGESVDIMTPLLSMGANGPAVITANGIGANVEIQSSAVGFGLTVNFNGAANNSQIVSTNGNVGFNTVNAGAIDIDNNPGQGLIAADNGGVGLGVVTFNGGVNPVSVKVNEIRGCVAGTGVPFSVIAATGGFGIGNINSPGASYTFIAPDITICGSILAGNIQLGDVQGGASGIVTNSINQGNTFTVTSDTAGGITLNTTTLNVSNFFLTTFAGAPINIQASVPASGLTVNMQNALASFNSGGAGGITFNPGTAGDITINGVGGQFGDINAGAGNPVTFNGGVVNVGAGANEINSITGTIVANNPAQQGIDIQTATGDLTFGSVVANGNANFEARGGNMTFSADVTVAAGNNLTASTADGAANTTTVGNGVTLQADSVTITTPILNNTAGATIRANVGNVLIDRAGNGALTVNMEAGSTIRSLAANVLFQQAGAAGEGPINVAGNAGLIQGVFIDWNAGPNALGVDVNQIIGCNRLNSSTGSLGSVAMETDVGVLDFCTDINTVNAAGAGGPITITANGGPVDLMGNNVLSSGTTNGGAIEISGSTGILNGGVIDASGGGGSGGGIGLAGGTGNVTTANIIATGATGGGNVGINSTGTITTGTITTSSTGGNAGGITANSGGDTVFGNLDASSTNGNGGAISTTSTGGNVGVGSVDASSGNGNGGSFTGSAVAGNITTGPIDVSGGGNGGQISTTSLNVMTGPLTANGGTDGGQITITTQNPLVIGGAGPNSISGDVNAVGTGGTGGTIAFFSQGGLTQNAGNTINANGGTTGGVITFNDSLGGAGGSTYDINGTVCAHVIGTIPPAVPNSGVVGFNAGAGQNLFLTVGATGNLKAGQQITIGNLNPSTGLPQGAPSGLLVVNPLPLPLVGPPPPFNTPLIVLNGSLFVPVTPTSPSVSGIGAFPPLPFFLQQNNIAELIGQFLPTDQTRIIEGSVQRNVDLAKGVVKNILPASKTFEHDFNHAEIARLAKEGNDVSTTNDRFITVNKGRIVFAPDKTISVRVKEGQVLIPGGAIVMIDENSADSAIYDLHQTSGNGVKVISEGKMIALHPGNMIFLSRENTDDFSKIDHDCKLIGYNDPRHKKLSDNVDAFSMDFSIPSVIKKVQPFRHMMNSTEKRDRLMIRKLIMNAVLLRDQMPYKGPYMTTANINP